MATPIEITNQTLLKLLVRRGTNTDRLQVALTEGEIGYTIDTQRLFVGNGSTKGGRPVGIKFLGQNATITNLNGLPDDLGYDNDDGLLRVITTGTGSVGSDWLTIGGPGSTLVDNQTIQKDSAGTISVLTVSADNIDPGYYGVGVERSGNTIQVKSTLTLDEIQSRTATLTLPQEMTLGDRTYLFPSNAPALGNALLSDSAGNLRWGAPLLSTDTLYVSQEQVPVGSVIAFLSGAAVPDGWFLTDGTALTSTAYPNLYSVIGTTYGSGNGTTTDFAVPDFDHHMLYGVESIPNTTVVNFTSGGNTSISAAPVVWIIKWRPDTVNVAKINITPALSATDSNGSSTSVINLSTTYGLGVNKGLPGAGNGDVIEGVARGRIHGIQHFTLGTPSDTAALSHNFTVPANTYQIKVTMTGGGGIGYSGASPWGTTGGSGSTTIVYLSCAPGHTYLLTVGGAGGTGVAGIGGDSFIALSGTTIATAGGAQKHLFGTPVIDDSTTIMGSQLLFGGTGGTDTNQAGGVEEAGGASSYYGSSPAPGGGSGSHSLIQSGYGPAGGNIVIEW
tara:strand:- start:4850 stop:6529 length:1680 start_codon:yes stop_codon:yes gene_type:complete